MPFVIDRTRFICPTCGESINGLRYGTDGREYGQCSLVLRTASDGSRHPETTEFDSDEFEGNETTYYCPECDDEINPDILVAEGEEQDDEESLTEKPESPNTDEGGAPKSGLECSTIVVRGNVRRIIVSICSSCGWKGKETSKCLECDEDTDLTVL